MEFVEGYLKCLFLLTFYLLPFFVVTIDGAQVESVIGDIACKLTDCGKGTCNGSADDKPPFYFDCECDPGWTQLKLGNITLPPCSLPNCTFDMGCGSPSPPPPVFPLTNSTDACSYTWCGEGTCKLTTGGIFPVPECICNEGSLNLLNLTGLPCVKECSLGVDCTNLGLGLGSAPPPSPEGSVPSDSSRSKGGDGGYLAKNGVKWVEGSIMLMVISIALQLIV